MAGECVRECETPDYNCGGISMPSPCGGCCECIGCLNAYLDDDDDG